MKTLIIKTKTGRIIIEMGPDDNPEEVIKEHEIKTTKYFLL